MNAADYRAKKRPLSQGVPMKFGNLIGGDKNQKTITNTYADSFNRTDTKTDVTENQGNTSLTLGGGGSENSPLIIGVLAILGAIFALR